MLIVARQQGALNHTIGWVRGQGTLGSRSGYPRRTSNVNRNSLLADNLSESPMILFHERIVGQAKEASL
jgi:hypothetical protein